MAEMGELESDRMDGTRQKNDKVKEGQGRGRGEGGRGGGGHAGEGRGQGEVMKMPPIHHREGRDRNTSRQCPYISER